jgi:prephenate dehydrogenase
VTGLDEGAPAPEVASRHDLVVLAVPIEATADVARRVGPRVRAGGCLADVTSLKRAPIDAMLEATAASVEVVGTHPLFGPGVSCMDRLTVAVCEGRGTTWMARLTALFEALGAEVVRVDAEEHDARMARVQAAVHAKSLALGHVLAAHPGGARALLATATPQLRAEVSLVARLAAAPSALLVGLLFENPHALGAVTALVHELSRLRDALEAGDRAFVARHVEALRAALGPSLEDARARSDALLEIAAQR